ncbi:hypothetical protein CGLO_14955 [Colletotrichum gloeosporioides Cg-14]|uniref:Uncharacterized protein n=1 Tax=Colletotrichum gloeosporioides (strain Cg-14) TaxID=1237896 RepID=T0JZU3_COLGC|nr:hypothetical protein CGLO_14955 [Colletotrichum gloeosporioides Cg-14]
MSAVATGLGPALHPSIAGVLNFKPGFLARCTCYSYRACTTETAVSGSIRSL